MLIPIFVQVTIMSLYVKGFKIDREKIAKMVGAKNRPYDIAFESER